MAVTSLWRVKGHIGKVVLYAMNEEKTTQKEIIRTDSDDTNTETALSDLISYTERDNATSLKRFVYGINCDPLRAAQNMMKVKKDFGKLDGTVAYHGYQSFKEGEVTPETAHEIGVKLATELWGDKYQVLVTTHLDKDSHLHNHFVINTVSFVDGKKFHRTKKDYYQMREVSDRLCKEYSLSVIENPSESRTKSYDEIEAQRNGTITKDDIIKRDIDECIKLAMSERDFYYRMKAKGYTFDFSRKYATISHPAFLKPRRLKSLGEEYTPESLERRIQESWRQSEVNIPEQDDLTEYFKPLSEPSYQKTYVKFVTIIENVKGRPDSNRNLYKLLGDEIRKFDKLIEQQNLLCDNDIDTPEQLAEYKQSCKDEIVELTEARSRLRNMLKTAERKGDTDNITVYKNDISLLSARLKKLRKDIVVCDRIEAQKPVIDERMNQCREKFEQNEMTGKKQKRTRARSF